MNTRSLCALAALTLATAWLLTGCASTTIESTGTRPQQTLCSDGAPIGTLSVLWGTHWRPDQKEPQLREAAALRGIENYFKAQACVTQLAIHRADLPDTYEQLTEHQLISMAHAKGDRPDKVIMLVVSELGPKLLIGLPTLIEGGTEVVLYARMTDARSGKPMAHLRTHWHRGGPFYIKGVKTLDQDMQATLNHIFSSAQETQDDKRP